MAGKTYSAGTIFLQVVPVFGDVQNAIRREAKDINRALGDELEKGGSEAGERAGKAIGEGLNKQTDKSLGVFEKRFRDTIRKASDSLGDSMDPAVQKIRGELEKLNDVRIGVDLSDRNALAKLRNLAMEARKVSQNSVSIQTKVDAGKSSAILAALYADIKKVDGKDVDIDVKVRGAAKAAGELSILDRLLKSNGAEGAANAFRSFNFRILAAVTLLPALIPLIAAVGGGLLGLIPILAAVGAGFGAMLVGFSGIGDAVGALGDQADNAAKDTSAAAKTIKSASYAVRDARQAVADAERNAAQASADAARQVADARRSAADAIEDALERQREAQEAYRDSVQDVREAEEDLREARKQAAEEAAAGITDNEDLKDRARQNALAIREAVLGTFDATNTFNAVMADGSSTKYDKEAAQVNMLQSREQLHELREEQKAIALERKQQRKDGVADNSAVESAQDALTAALERQREAQEAVGDAAEEVNEARVDGARQVADAVRAQQRTEADGARSIRRAQEDLRRAQEAYGQALYETGELGSASMQKVELAMGKLGPAGRKFARFLFSLRDDFYAFRDAIQSAMLPGIQRAIETIINRYGPQFTAFMVEMGAVTGRFFERLSNSLQGPVWARFFGIMERLGPRMAAEFGDTTINWLKVFASIMTAVAPFAERMSRAMLQMSEGAARWARSEKGQATITRFMEYAERIGPKVISFLESFVAAAINLAVALAPWGTLVMDALTGILDWIAAMDPKTLGLIAGALIGLVIAWQAAVGAVALFFGGMSAFQTLAGRVAFGIVGLVVGLALLALQFDGVRHAIAKVGDFLAEHRQGLLRIATIILTVVAAYKLWRFITATMIGIQVGYAAALSGSTAAIAGHSLATRIAAGVTRAWMIAQGLLNATMLGFPLIWIVLAIAAVVAAVIWLWKENETFRDIVLAVWEKVKGAFAVAKKVIGKVIDGIARVVRWLWKNVFKPTFGFIKDVVTTVFKAIRTVWNNVLWPVIKVIGKVIWNVWKFYFKVAFYLIEAAFKVLVVAMKLAWKTILQPVFEAIGRVLKWLWEKVGRPIFGFLGDQWDLLVRGMKIVWNNVLAPLFEYIGDKVLPKLKSAFRETIDNIKAIWDDLRRIIGAPIKFVIETVLNNGLIAGFNKVANFVNGPTIDKIPVPEWTYATGGVLPGYTPGKDVHHFSSPTGGRLHLSGGEAIMRPEWTNAMGAEYVAQMNRIAATGGAGAVRRAMGGGARYAKGGIFYPLPGGHNGTYPGHDGVDINVGSGSDDLGMKFYSATSGRVTTTGYSRGYGNAVFVQSPYGELVYGHSLDGSIAVRPGQSVSPGSFLARVGSTGNSSAPHLHFGFPGGTYEAALALLRGAPVGQAGEAGGGVNLPGWIEAIIGKPMEWAKGLFNKATDFVTDKFGNSPFLNTVMGLGEKLLDPIVDKVTNLLSGPEFKANNPLANVAAGAVQATVRAIADNYGWDQGPQWNALVELVQRESSWNPNADNPDSSAAGLFQKMTSLHGPLEKTVAGQARWGLNYIKDRYGSPVAALRFHDAHGSYESGGILPGGESTPGYNGTMMYDSGGYLPPGITQVVNLTGKPEPVFTADQFSNMREGGGGITYAPVITEANLTSEELMDDFEFTARKLSRRSGRYRGVQS